MLGTSGAGKTTYMLGLNEVLGMRSIQDFKIVPASTSVMAGLAGIGEFRQHSFEATDYEFPEGTKETTFWHFSLLHRTREITSFRWVDYRGGCIDDLFGTSQPEEEVTSLLGHIAVSNGVMVFCDAVSIAQYSENQAFRWTGARNVIQLLELFSHHFPNSTLSVVVVLTKADSDLIPDELRKSNFEGLVSKTKSVFRDLGRLCEVNRPRWRGGIVPVGVVGVGNVESEICDSKDFRRPNTVTTKIVASPEPFNVEHPLFYTIGNVLAFMKTRAEQDLAAHRAAAQQAFDSSNIFREIWSKMTDAANPNDLVDLHMHHVRALKYSLETYKTVIDPLVKLACLQVREL